MSNKIIEYKDLIAFHPGQYVEELIEDYNVTQKEFANRLVCQLLRGLKLTSIRLVV